MDYGRLAREIGDRWAAGWPGRDDPRIIAARQLLADVGARLVPAVASVWVRPNTDHTSWHAFARDRRSIIVNSLSRYYARAGHGDLVSLAGLLVHEEAHVQGMGEEGAYWHEIQWLKQARAPALLIDEAQRTGHATTGKWL
jgi:hypothetical protein